MPKIKLNAVNCSIKYGSNTVSSNTTQEIELVPGDVLKVEVQVPLGYSFRYWQDSRGFTVYDSPYYLIALTDDDVEDFEVSAVALSNALHSLYVYIPPSTTFSITAGQISENYINNDNLPYMKIYQIAKGTPATVAFSRQNHTFVAVSINNYYYSVPYGSTEYDFEMPDTDVNIAPIFDTTAVPLTVEYDATLGSIAGLNKIYKHGDTVVLTAHPTEVANFAGWYDTNNIRISQEATYSFTITQPTTLRAIFTRKVTQVKFRAYRLDNSYQEQSLTKEYGSTIVLDPEQLITGYISQTAGAYTTKWVVKRKNGINSIEQTYYGFASLELPCIDEELQVECYLVLTSPQFDIDVYPVPEAADVECSHELGTNNIHVNITANSEYIVEKVVINGQIYTPEFVDNQASITVPSLRTNKIIVLAREIEPKTPTVEIYPLSYKLTLYTWNQGFSTVKEYPKKPLLEHLYQSSLFTSIFSGFIDWSKFGSTQMFRNCTLLPLPSDTLAVFDVAVNGQSLRYGIDYITFSFTPDKTYTLEQEAFIVLSPQIDVPVTALLLTWQNSAFVSTNLNQFMPSQQNWAISINTAWVTNNFSNLATSDRIRINKLLASASSSQAEQITVLLNELRKLNINLTADKIKAVVVNRTFHHDSVNGITGIENKRLQIFTS